MDAIVIVGADGPEIATARHIVAVLCFMDLPFSLAADTLLLPMTVSLFLLEGPMPEPPPSIGDNLHAILQASKSLRQGEHAYPKTLGEIPDALLADRHRQDPWGNEYALTIFYTLLGPQIQVRSLGPDGVVSDDDIIHGHPGSRVMPAPVVPIEPSGREDVMVRSSEDAAERGNHFFRVRIPERARALERGDRYDKLLEGALEFAALGKVTGGDSQLGEGGSVEYRGIHVEVNDREEGLRLLVEVMALLGPPSGTAIEEYLPDRRDYPVYGP